MGVGVEEVEGGGAEISVAAVGGGQGGVGAAGDLLEGLGEECAAGVEFAGVGFGEGLAGEIEAEEAGIVLRGRRDAFGVVGAKSFVGEDGGTDGSGDGGALFEAAGLGG